MSQQSHDCTTWRHVAIALLIVMVLVVLMDIVQFRLDQRFELKQQQAAAEAPREPMTMWEQCMLWNKWADWPQTGQCPGDLQPRWYP